MEVTTHLTRVKRNAALTEEQKQAIRDVAGRRKDDPSLDRLMAEVEAFRERLRKEETARQEEGS